jgi:hypothetical protein
VNAAQSNLSCRRAIECSSATPESIAENSGQIPSLRDSGVQSATVPAAILLKTPAERPHLSGLDRERMRQQGTLIAFPSFLEHRDAPVTRVERFSLVAWVDGPPYR